MKLYFVFVFVVVKYFILSWSSGGTLYMDKNIFLQKYQKRENMKNVKK
jgi:hypothetical protein